MRRVAVLVAAHSVSTFGQPVCIADGLCSGGAANCCNGTLHQTLKCGVDACGTCTDTVDQISAAASQGCDEIGPQICSATPLPSVCETIVSESCDTIIAELAKGWSPEKICDSLGFCGAGFRCGCLPDGECAIGAATECCSGRIHATAKCPTSATGGGRCGCVPADDCAQVPQDCCSGVLHKTLKCGAGIAGGRCDFNPPGPVPPGPAPPAPVPPPAPTPPNPPPAPAAAYRCIDDVCTVSTSGVTEAACHSICAN